MPGTLLPRVRLRLCVIGLAVAASCDYAASPAGSRALDEGDAPMSSVDSVRDRPREGRGVAIYQRHSFDEMAENWSAVRGATLTSTDDAAAGRAVAIDCDEPRGGARRAVRVDGSEGLKMVLHMKSQQLPSVGVNIFDDVAKDNTTPYGYRLLKDNQWTPLLYYLDRFHYNSRGSGFVNKNTRYSDIRFFGPVQPGPDAQFSIDNFVIYRGEDSEAPGQVRNLVARPTPEGVQLVWEAAPDNVASMVYAVARATPEGTFEKIAECATTSFLDRSASAGPYRYRVLAVDFQENLGPWCDPVSVTATAAVQPPEPSREERDRPAYAANVRAIHAAGQGSVRAGQATLFGDSLTGATLYAHLSGAALLTMRVDAFGSASKRTDFGRGSIARILQDQKPELVLILFGTNNRKDPASIPAAMADMEAIVQSCAAQGSIPIIGTIPPRGFKDPDSAPEAEFNRQLIEMAGRQKIPAAYIFESIQAAGSREQFIARDGVHWNAAGMELAARAWGRAVEQVRFALRDLPDAQAASDKRE